MSSLRDRVEDFIANRAGPVELHNLLLECLREGTAEGLAAVRRLYQDMYGGFTYNFEMKAPAASCLINWGEQGLRELVAGANADPTSKNVSLCVQILSTIASGRPLSRLSFIRDDSLASMIRERYEKLGGITEIARAMLIQFVLSLENDDDVASVAGLLSRHNDDVEASKELFTAISARWLAVGEPVLQAFERLIEEHPEDEAVFQDFLIQHPQLLDPMAIQVWPEPNIFGFKYPDFVVRRADDSYLVVEIECPAKALIKGGHASAAVTHAEHQATYYRDYLIQHHRDANQHFPNFSDPDCMVVTGLERDLSDTERTILAHVNRHRVRLRIVGFDWLSKRARSIATNVMRREVEIIKARIT